MKSVCTCAAGAGHHGLWPHLPFLVLSHLMSFMWVPKAGPRVSGRPGHRCAGCQEPLQASASGKESQTRCTWDPASPWVGWGVNFASCSCSFRENICLSTTLCINLLVHLNNVSCARSQAEDWATPRLGGEQPGHGTGAGPPCPTAWPPAPSTEPHTAQAAGLPSGQRKVRKWHLQALPVLAF